MPHGLCFNLQLITMASSQPMRLPSMMADALSCYICLLQYDLQGRMPKIFPCLHTVCLSCASELCQRHLDAEFPCPTCRQPVTIPSKGALGLQTNLDVRNIVEIIQKTKTSSYASPDCPEHPLVPVSNVCMQCEVGLCPKCVTTSAMRDHVDHQILEVKDAFEALRKSCDSLVEKGKETTAMFQAMSTKISDTTTDLLDAMNSNSLSVFAMIKKFSALITSFTTTPNQTEPSMHIKVAHGPGTKMSDGYCNANALQRSLKYLKHGASKLESISRPESSNSIVCTKLAAVALQVEILHLQLDNETDEARRTTLRYLVNLTDDSEPCSARFVLLGGVDLLLSCIENFILNVDILRSALLLYGNLAECEELHSALMTTRAVNMLTRVINNFTMEQKQVPEYLCGILSLLLINPCTQWRQDCLSRDEASTLAMNTVKQFKLNEPVLNKQNSFLPYVALLQQKVSEAAKYWAIWTLNRFTDQRSEYCTMLVRDGGIPVLKQLEEHADEYIRDMSRRILNRIA